MNKLFFFLSLVFSISKAISSEGSASNDLFVYALVVLNLIVSMGTLAFLMGKKTESVSSIIQENKISDNESNPLGMNRLKELFSCDFSLAKLVIEKTLLENDSLANYVICRLPMADLLELRKTLDLEKLQAFIRALENSKVQNNQKIDSELEQVLLNLIYETTLMDTPKNKYDVIRAERWATLIKKDIELGRHLFLFSEMKFLAKVFSFLDEADIHQIMDVIFQQESEVTRVKEKINEYLEEAKNKNQIDLQFQKMMSYFSKFNEKNIGIGIEKLSVFYKNEVKVFDILINNMTPSLINLIPSEIFWEIKQSLPEGCFYRYMISLPQENRSDIFNRFFKENSLAIDSYKRFLASAETSDDKDVVRVRFKKEIYKCISEDAEVYQDLFNYWKLPLKRLSSGMSFDNAFKEFNNLKKSA